MVIFSSPALGQLKIGYINSNRILMEYKEAVEVEQKFQKEVEKSANEINKMKATMDSLYADFERKQLIWSEQKKADTQARLQAMYAEIQQKQMDKFGEQGEMQKLRADLLQPVLEKIDKVIKEIGQEQDFDFIFDAIQGNIVYSKEDKYDITDQVLEKLK